MDEGRQDVQSGSSRGRRRGNRRQRHKLENSTIADGSRGATGLEHGSPGRPDGANLYNPSERLRQRNEAVSSKSPAMNANVQRLFDSAAPTQKKENATLQITATPDGRRNVYLRAASQQASATQNAYQPESSEYPALDRENLSGKGKSQKSRRYRNPPPKTQSQPLHAEEPSNNWRTRNNSTSSSGQSQKSSTTGKEQQNLDSTSKPGETKILQSALQGTDQKTTRPLNLNKLQSYQEEVLEKHGKKYMDELEKHQIHMLRKINNRFPEARFFCRLCDYHVDRVNDVEDHRSSDSHERKYRLFKDDKFLKNIPLPTSSHIKSLTDMLESLYSRIVLSNEEYTQRVETVKKLELIIQANDQLKDVCLELTGSVRSKLATTDSDTNIRIITKKQEDRATVLKEIWTLVQNEDWISEHDFQFKTRIPFIKFDTVELPHTSFSMTYAEEPNTVSCQLLKWYSENYPLVRKIAVLFKYFAKLCKMADADQGAIAPYCYSIMAISYCQLREECPVVLEDYSLEGAKLEAFEKQLNEHVEEKGDQWRMHHQYGERARPDDLGSMWLDLLKFYGVEFKRDVLAVSILTKALRKSQRQWGTKRLCIEDPAIPKRNMTNSISHTQVADYILDKLRLAYTYFAIPLLESGPAFNCVQQNGEILVNRMKLNPTENNPQHAGEDNSANKDTSAEFTTDTSGETNPSSSTQDDDQHIEDGSEQTQSSESGDAVAAADVEEGVEPAAVSSGVKSSGENIDVLSDGDDLQIAEHTAAPLDGNSSEHIDEMNISVDDHESGEIITGSEIEIKNEVTVDQSDGDVKEAADMIERLGLSGGDKSERTEDSHDKYKKTRLPNKKAKRKEQSGKKDKVKEKFYVNEDKIEKILYDEEKVVNLKSEDMFFSMDKDKFPFCNDTPPIFCRLCAKPGHLAPDCPDEELPSCLPLPPPSAEHVQKLSDILHRLKDQNQMTDIDSVNRSSVLEDIKVCLVHDFPDVELTLFGSSKNGLGFPDSDLDICMTFTSKKFVGDEENRSVIKQVAKLLTRDTNFCGVTPIPTAKVPICKFYHVGQSLLGDISLYNILAQRNTALLRRYCDIDDRVRVLGYTVKEFAKRCEIGDASRGSLSSYAYTLIMLHYLQRTSPPVIPVLQELYQTEEQPENIIEGWNTWFFEGENEHLELVWSDYGKNKQSVGELWIGFLEYYATSFDYKNCVVCIRKQQELTKFEKLWHSSTLAIEDPFDLQHNLASGLSKNMHAYIMKAIIHARKHFHTSVDKLPDKYISLYQYLFDGNKLTQGKQAPNDRGCHVCRKIGHIAKTCPELLERKRRQELAKKRIHNSNSNGSAPGSPHKPNNPRVPDYVQNPPHVGGGTVFNMPYGMRPQHQYYPQNFRQVLPQQQQQHHQPRGQHHHVPEQHVQHNTRPQHHNPHTLPPQSYDPIRAQGFTITNSRFAAP